MKICCFRKYLTNDRKRLKLREDKICSFNAFYSIEFHTFFPFHLSLLMLICFYTGNNGFGTNISVQAYDDDIGANANLSYAILSGNINDSFEIDVFVRVIFFYCSLAVRLG